MTSRFPSRDLAVLRRQLDRVFDDATGDDRPTTWRPRADVAETDGAYLLALDLPGVDRDSLDVTLDDGTLRISGERQTPSGDGHRMHRVERAHGRFFRSFTLGSDLDGDAIKARYDDGVLTVEIGKTPEVQPRRISIGSRGDSHQAQDATVTSETDRE